MEKDHIELNLALEEKAREKIADVLHQLLASMYGLYLKTQNYHWNVTGLSFPSLHALFQSQYEELAEAIDEVAERIRALGFFPQGALGTFLKLSLVKDETKVRSPVEMVTFLLEDNQRVVTFMHAHLQEIEKTGDGATADLINKRLAVHEKAAWILRSIVSQIK